MISKDIVDYVKAQIEKGVSKEEIKKALVSAGWQVADIDEAFKTVLALNIPAPSYGTDLSSMSRLPSHGALFTEA